MEQPNLTVIKEIAGSDKEFQNNLLEIIKLEFHLEVELFNLNFSQNKFKEASYNVHKIKHKISLLGLEKGFETAYDYENSLKTGDTKLHQDFLKILNKIHVYLYK